jgi:hypothetical protein
MASAAHARRVRPTVALSVAKAVGLRPVVVAIAVRLLVVARPWQTARPTPSARPSLHQKNAQASCWSTVTRHRASVAAHQPVLASVRASVVASLSNR